MSEPEPGAPILPATAVSAPLLMAALLMVDSLHFVFARILVPYLPGVTAAFFVLAVAAVELFIIMAAFKAGYYWAVGIFIFSLCVIFAGFGNQVMKICFNDSPVQVDQQEKINMVWPQYILLLTSLILCFFIPDTLYQTIIDAVTAIGGGLK